MHSVRARCNLKQFGPMGHGVGGEGGLQAGLASVFGLNWLGSTFVASVSFFLVHTHDIQYICVVFW